MAETSTPLLDSLSLFHGTGALAHDFGSNKYAEKVTEGVRDTLNIILQEGLRTFPDPLNPHFSATISLTRDPMYAVLYALLFSEKGTSKKYPVERWKEWSRILWQIRRDAKPFSRKKYKAEGTRIVGMKELHRWTHAFNQQDYNHLLGGFRGMIWGESDIPGNFPVIIGIKNTLEVNVMPGWNEVRSSSGIPPQDIGAIFVPSEKIGDFHSDTIPVLPFEAFVEFAKARKTKGVLNEI